MAKELIDSESSTIEQIVESIKISLPRVVITFGSGHPFDLVKTRMQANPYIHSGVLLSKEIYRETGIRGFYTAGLPNFTRAILKESYRSPLRGMLSAKYGNIFPEMTKEKKALMTGFSMALADTMIMCPLERLKVWLMTKHEENKSIYSFFSNRSTENIPLYQDLFKGASVSLARSTVSWVTYLVPEAFIRNAVIKYSPRVIDKTGTSVPLAENILIGALGGIVNGICTLPLDTIKTNIQKEGFHEKASLKTMWEIGANLVDRHGFTRGLYPAFLTRLVHYSMVGIITSNLMQRVDAIWQPKQKM
ncbi:MAG: hypothetical protein JSS53_07585 [Proteobacteria bacterium]|nr:hypothetical protein [Pseudomonadota bacterium]